MVGFEEKGVRSLSKNMVFHQSLNQWCVLEGELVEGNLLNNKKTHAKVWRQGAIYCT